MNKQEFDDALKAWLAEDLESVSTALEDRLLRAMFYGDIDSGKTTLIGQIVKALGCRAVLFNTDSSWTVLQKDPEAAALIHRRRFTGFKQLKVFARAHAEGIEPFCNYGALLWDTASTGVYNTLRKAVATTPTYKDQKHPDVEGWTHYGLIKAHVRDLVEDLNKSNLHIIYTAHYREPSENDAKKVVKEYGIRPNIPEATFQLFAQEVQLLGWLHKENQGQKRQIQFEGTLRTVAKSQIPGIDEKIYPVSEVPEMIQKWVNK